MKLTELIARTNLVLDNVNARKWDTAGKTVAQTLNDQIRSVVRSMIKTDQGYTNYRFVLPKTVARAVHQTDFSYRLPRWLSKIVHVRQYLGAGAAQGPTIRRASKFQTGGWRLSGVNELLLLGYSATVDLEIECAKLPALLTLGTLQAASSTTLTIDSDSSANALNFPHETEVNAYSGGLFEITSGVAAGQTLRCVSNTNVPTGRVLTMEEAWSPTPGNTDTYEMHAEIADEHLQLVILLAARRLLAQEGNAKGLAVYAPELSEQWSLFQQSMATRQIQEPSFIGSAPDVESDRTAFEDWA